MYYLDTFLLHVFIYHFSSEEERQKLLNQLRQKEEDYLGLQDRLHKLNNNLTHVQKQHRKQLGTLIIHTPVLE